MIHERHKQKRLPNWIPLVDIVFLLLVFFMATVQFERIFPLKVQQAQQGMQLNEPYKGILYGEGQFMLEGKAMDEASLRAFINSAEFDVMRPLVMAVKDDVSSKAVVELMDMMAELKVTNFFLQAE